MTTFKWLRHHKRVQILMHWTWSIAACVQSAAIGADIPQLQWARHVGTSEVDYLNSVASDQVGNVFTVGGTYGVLGNAQLGNGDALLMKYNPVGDLIWARQFGSLDGDEGFGVSVDSHGSAYVVGGFGANPNGIGNSDAFVRKYDALGNLEWSQLLASSQDDVAAAISIDQSAGRIYVSGHTRGILDVANSGGLDAFIAQYDFEGTLQWARQLGSASVDHGASVAADGLGNVYLAGTTFHRFDNPPASDDAFVAKYDALGNLLWRQEIATSGDDRCLGMATDDLGNVFIAGNTSGDLDGSGFGGVDIFISRIDSSGALQWTKQIGTNEGESASSVVAGEVGNVYFVGNTTGVLGENSSGRGDAVIGKINSQGQLQWLHQLGSNEFDAARGISYSSSGRLQVVGLTTGDLGGIHAGSGDGFVLSVHEIPEPRSRSLCSAALALIASLVTRNNRRRRGDFDPVAQPRRL
jgi:hypothetical protein